MGSKKDEYPNICLIKNTRINENQDAIFKGLNKEYKGKFATVVSNGNGVKMYHPDLPLTFKVAGVTVTRGEFFKGDIADVLQYFKDNGGVIKFPRIIVIAGELAGRCISYVTRDYGWHLTDMYYNPSASTSIPEMIQSVGRLCGLNKGKSHLHLHVTHKVAEALWNGFNFTNEVINRAIASPLMNLDEEMSFGDSIKSVPMLTTKMPDIKRSLTNKVKVNKKDYKLVSKDDGGESVESYKYKVVKEPVAKVAKVETLVATPIVESVAKELPVMNKVPIEDINVNFNAVTKIYNRKGSKVKLIIECFISKNFTPLSVEEIRKSNVSLEKINITNYDRWEGGRSAKYKILVQKTPGLYILCSKIIDHLKII
jgi:hypothetical protein